METSSAAVFGGAVAVALLLVALGLPVAAATTSVEAVDRLRGAGAVSLALRLIDREQPAFSDSPVSWQRWERQRLAILESRQDWPAIVALVADYPPSLPDDFRVSAKESAARSHLAMGDAEAATAIITDLIWGTTQDTAGIDERVERLNRWRRMLVDSYLLAGRLRDAETAVLRYRLDYAGDPNGWRIGHAKGLMRAGRDMAARELLAGLDSTEVAYLKLLLVARSHGADPVELLSKMDPFLAEGRLLAAERAQLWAALANTAARYRDREMRVMAMEQAVALRAPIAAQDQFVSVDADSLWDAYGDYAVALANESHLLVGRFDAWLVLAERYAEIGDLKARAMYAYLATQDRDARVADIARIGLLSTLVREPGGLAVLGGLYLESRRYAEISTIPETLRAPLIAYAVDESLLDVARMLLAGLDAETRLAVSLQWRAPLALALIGDGRIDEAVALFDEEFYADASADASADADGDGGPRESALDAAVRVALALQAVGEYAHSTTLLSRASALADSPWQRRELLLLMAQAESYAGDHERAAQLYIESAAVPGDGPADTWSRSASLQAARALARAGLDDDAVGVLKATLSDSPLPDERLVVERALRRY